MRPVVIIGDGGHAKVIADALMESGCQVLGFTSKKNWHDISFDLIPGVPLLGSDEALRRYQTGEIYLANGLGGVDCSGLRRDLQHTLEMKGWTFMTVRHPTAFVSQFAEISNGVHLLAGCIVQAGARIGTGSIVNTAAVIEHDCMVGTYVHVAPRAIVCGSTEVGSDSHIGAGAVVRQGLKLGSGSLVGAGAVVVKNFSGDGTLVGVPARQQ